MTLDQVTERTARIPDATGATVHDAGAAVHATGGVVHATAAAVPATTRTRVVAAARVAGRLLIAGVGVLGGLVVLWAALSALLGLSLVILVTGSMSPTMPAGTVAVVQQVDADEVRIGDVVTVPRPGYEVPVTHRVVAIEPPSGGSGPVLLTLRGDANPVDDPEPYAVEQVQRVVTAVPGAGALVAWLVSPFVRMLLVVVVAGVVCWALWPRRPAQSVEES